MSLIVRVHEDDIGEAAAEDDLCMGHVLLAFAYQFRGEPQMFAEALQEDCDAAQASASSERHEDWMIEFVQGVENLAIAMMDRNGTGT